MYCRTEYFGIYHKPLSRETHQHDAVRYLPDSGRAGRVYGMVDYEYRLGMGV